jgi:hypothetical protein
MLNLFCKFMIECLPHIEDEPKVAVTEILNILLPVFLTEQMKVKPYSKNSIVVKTFKLLL